MSETIQRIFKCDGCGCEIELSQEDAEWKANEKLKPCFVTECHGSPQGECHPEFFNETCAMCECAGEICD